MSQHRALIAPSPRHRHSRSAEYEYGHGARGRRYGDDDDEARSVRSSANRRHGNNNKNHNHNHSHSHRGDASGPKGPLVWLAWAAAATVAAIRLRHHVSKGGNDRWDKEAKQVERGRAQKQDAYGRALARRREEKEERRRRSVYRHEERRYADPALARCGRHDREADCDYYLRRQRSRAPTAGIAPAAARRGHSAYSRMWGRYL